VFTEVTQRAARYCTLANIILLISGGTVSAHNSNSTLSICKLDFVSHSYESQRVSLRGIVGLNADYGLVLVDVNCLGKTVFVKLSNASQLDPSIRRLLDYMSGPHARGIAGKKLHCICAGVVQYAPSTTLKLETVRKIWLST
jgi:hypothetical protein